MAGSAVPQWSPHVHVNNEIQYIANITAHQNRDTSTRPGATHLVIADLFLVFKKLRAPVFAGAVPAESVDPWP